MNADEVELRPAQPSDAPAIAEIWHLGWRDGHLGHVPRELLAARHEDSFRARVPARLTDTTVAVIDGDIAGFVMVVDDEIEQVYVARSHRGTGVADVLMAEAERQIDDAGHAGAWLAVVAGNAWALAVLRASRVVRSRSVRLSGGQRSRAHPGAVSPVHQGAAAEAFSSLRLRGSAAAVASGRRRRRTQVACNR